ncbi:MAG TPA: hypothetical protein DHW40_02555 [Microbacterium sp.]|nr:hypothetical protein [Microbacterium sp.]
MGVFTYGSNTRLSIDDRTLAHLEVVIGSKLRRGESFMFMWPRDGAEGGGRACVWINRASQLAYRYRGDARSRINPGWIELLASAANSPHGLHLVAEPDADRAAG